MQQFVIHMITLLLLDLYVGDSNYKQYLPYYILAGIMVGVAILLSLPFFYRPGVPALASCLTGGRVQLPRLHKLAPLFDVFQGVYKPKMQFFTGLHLLYRVALWSAAAFLD